MNLAEYLIATQARDDVRTDVTGWDRSGGTLQVRYLDGQRYVVRLDRVKAWARIRIEWDDDDSSATAYYRPDGDRYVVTDLGEGVRALRLRTGAKYIDILQKCRRTTRVNHFYGAFGQIYDATIGAGNWERGSGIGALFDASTEADQANLPDAICRVMLASLRVMEAVL